MDNKKLAVVGLGYVGLPLALLAQEKGWSVSGLDVDASKVENINRGVSVLLDGAINQALKKYPIVASTNPASVADARVIVIAVPTPVTKFNLPDLEPLISALESILSHLHSGQVLIVESTINPGVMDEVVMPILAGRPDLDVHVAHCPERINPGDSQWNVRNIPRVVGAYTPAGLEAAKDFYESIIEAPIMAMGSIREAEAVKIMENTFRDVNIAFVNEMARSFDALGIDIMSVIAGAKTKPFAFMAHYPGNGVGGHCISVDPYYMIEKGRQVGFDHEFLKLARQINDGMPAYTVKRLEFGLHKLGIKLEGAPIALLGLAYKKNVADLRESPALDIEELLLEAGVKLRVYDPFVPEKSNVKDLPAALAGAKAIMLATDHDELVRQLTPEALRQAGIKVVLDGKNALDADGIAKVGIPYYGIGRSRV